MKTTREILYWDRNLFDVALRDLNNKKTSGVDVICVELLKSAGEEILDTVGFSILWVKIINQVKEVLLANVNWNELNVKLNNTGLEYKGQKNSSQYK